MSDPNLPTEEGDRPIIIQGGSSVSIIVPSSFNEQVAGTQQPSSGGQGKEKDFKNGNVHLLSLQIDENTPIPLNKNSKITITYK